jgi:protein TonB
VLAAPPPPTPAPAPIEVPPQIETPPPPVFVAPAPAPEPPRPPAPAAPEPRAIDIGTVRYLAQPVLVYPPQSKRLGEQGRVQVRVLVDASGLPKETQVVRSSGFARLDEAALATVRATRFKPYTENGIALAFWVVMPLVFELEN